MGQRSVYSERERPGLAERGQLYFPTCNVQCLMNEVLLDRPVATPPRCCGRSSFGAAPAFLAVWGGVYSVQQGQYRYSVTVIDYTNSEAIHSKVTKELSFQDPRYWQIDIQASIQYAATKYRQRPGAKVTYDAWQYIDLVEGHQLQLTNADQSRTFVGIYLHENRLYIVEATVPPRAPAQGMFQQNLSFLNETGGRVRYSEIYSNRLPPLPARGGGRGRGGAGRGDGAGGTRGGAAQ